MHEMPATAIHDRPAVPEPRGGVRGGSGTLDDPRFLQVLTTEHWSLLTARSLADNEAFTRTGMFLTFLSMSFVGLALVGPPLSFSRTLLIGAVWPLPLLVGAVVAAFVIVPCIASAFRGGTGSVRSPGCISARTAHRSGAAALIAIRRRP
ncbi:MAG: hypothetical protein H0U52_12250 [Chloroflexi bacterium]|nr:hypothetical protein [Chloroflexota bacterium]